MSIYKDNSNFKEGKGRQFQNNREKIQPEEENKEGTICYFEQHKPSARKQIRHEKRQREWNRENKEENTSVERK